MIRRQEGDFCGVWSMQIEDGVAVVQESIIFWVDGV